MLSGMITEANLLSFGKQPSHRYLSGEIARALFDFSQMGAEGLQLMLTIEGSSTLVLERDGDRYKLTDPTPQGRLAHP